MRNWTIGAKLFSGFGALLALVLVSGAVSMWAVGSLNEAYDKDAGATAKKLLLAANLQAEALKCKSGSRRILLAAFAKDQKAFEEGMGEIDTSLNDISRLSSEIEQLVVTDAGKKSVKDSEATAKQWKKEIDDTVGMIKQGKVEEAWQHTVSDANPLVEKFLKDEGALIEQQKGFLAEGMQQTDALYSMARWMMIVVMFVSLLVGAAVVYTVRGVNVSLRATATELREASEQVVSASGQVATAAQSLSQGATEQAASLEESSASMEEMGSMTHQNAENASQAATLMVQMDQQVSGSNKLLQEMVTSMSAIQESSGKVSKIIKTIDEIAFQTNILALNAAVEAARAGEAGMGFAVVADEVRSLAQRAAQAARDTAGLIDEAGANAQEGSQKVERVAASISQFTESVGKVKGIAEGVSAASQQQSQGISQVTTAIQQMEKVTQTTAATAEESAAASEELNAQAEMTMQLVERLEALVGRASHGHVEHAKPAKRPSAKVVKLGTPAHAAPKSAEQAIPLEQHGTGTFGSF